MSTHKVGSKNEEMAPCFNAKTVRSEKLYAETYWSIFSQKQSKSGFIKIIAILLIAFLVEAFFTYLLIVNDSSIVAIVILWIFWIYQLFRVCFYAKIFAKRQMKRNDLSEYEQFCFYDDHILITNSNSRISTTSFYRNITAIKQTSNYIILFAGQNTPLVIAKSGFEKNFAEALAFLQAKCNA